MSGETTLLPCPFCGGEADVMLSQSRWGQSYTIHHAEKGRCPAGFVASMQFATEAEAIAAWNARVELGSGTCPFARPTDLTDGCAALERIAELEELGSGTLTAEQVREAIEHNFGKVAVIDDGGEKVEWREGWVCNVGINYKAIADELNARADDYKQAAEYWKRMYEETFAERTCHRFWTGAEMVCSRCAHQLNNATANYCPNCGAKVVCE